MWMNVRLRMVAAVNYASINSVALNVRVREEVMLSEKTVKLAMVQFSFFSNI